MALAGRKALVKASGAAVAFLDEPTTKVTANTVYQITNTAKRVLDRTATITVEVDADGAGAGGFVVADPSTYTLNRLTGTVTFSADQGVDAVVRMDGSYLPLTTVAEARSYSYALAGENATDNEFGDSYVTRLQVMKDASGSLSRWYDTSTYWQDAFTGGTVFVLEFYSDSTAAYDLKMWAILDTNALSAAFNGLVEQEVAFSGTVDSDNRMVTT